MGVFEFMAYWINEVPDHLKTQGSCIDAVEKCALLLKYVPDHFKTQEMCNEAVRIEPYSLEYVPDHFKTQEICKEAVHNHPYTLEYVPDKLKTQEMCDDLVHKDAWLLEYVPNCLKTQEMCERAVKEDRDSLIHGSDWFVVAQEMWYIDYSHIAAPGPRGCGDRAIKWYEGYTKCKTQKAKIKEELLPITWHPDRVMNWFMSQDEKRPWK